MLRFWKWSVVSCALVASVLVLSLSAADEKKTEKKAADKSEAKPEAKADEKPVDLDNVPEGTNEELMAYIKKAISVPPKSEEDFMKLSAAVNKAADKVLDANPNEKDLKTIIALRMRIPMEPEAYKPYAEKLTKIGAELTKSGKAELGREITSVSYLVKINAAGEEPEPFKKAIEEALAYFGESKLEKGDLMFVMSIAQMLESFPDDKFVGDSLEKIVKYLSDSKIEDVEKVVKQLEGTLRRMKLVGNKIELEGNLLSGDKLDLAKYKGKVYLVDFWATWCGPCVAEVPNMKKNYEAYHDKGFEIIGLSCDKSQDVIENFVKEKEIPWAIVYGDKAPSPSFEYYGISGIPTMILVGKDGKVISTTARGEELDKLLEKALGPAEKKEKKDDKKLQLKKEKKPAEKATK